MKIKFNYTKVSEKIMHTFLQDSYTLMSASEIYQWEASQKKTREPWDKSESWNHRTVAYYFYRFKRYDWFDEERKPVDVVQKSKTGKFTHRILQIPHFRLNFKFYFDLKKRDQNIEISTESQEFLMKFLNYDLCRDYVATIESNPSRAVDRVLLYLLLFSHPFYDTKSLLCRMSYKKPESLKSLYEMAEKIDFYENNWDEYEGAWKLIALYAYYIQASAPHLRADLQKLVPVLDDYDGLFSYLKGRKTTKKRVVCNS
ncbi:MAG: hypothetical protein QW727_00175 [Candidatus Pacearchaeota archaeon]